jgi:hypothetical protein
MSVRLIKKDGKKYLFQMEVELDDISMLSSEEQIQDAVNELGSVATTIALQQFETQGEAIIKSGLKMSSKGKQKKSTIRPTAQ